MKNKVRLTSLVSLGLTVASLAMLATVKYYREHTSYRLPTPWWMAGELRIVYVSCFLLGLVGLIGCGTALIIRHIKKDK